MSVNRFKVNNVTYTAKPFDFGMVCDLETFGVSISSASNMNMSFIRGYFAICADMTKEEAAAEIQEHMMKGGNLEDISNAMTKEMNESDFFRALAERNKTGEDEIHPEDGTTSAPEKKRGRKPNASTNP